MSYYIGRIRKILALVYRFLLLWHTIVYIRSVYGPGRRILAHGSTGDTALIASFADAHVEQNGRTIFICSIIHRELFARFVFHPNAILVFFSENKCQLFRVSWQVVSFFFSDIERGNIINPCVHVCPAHIVLYPEINKSVIIRLEGNRDGIHYLDALRNILSLATATNPRSPQYSKLDYQLLMNILAYSKVESCRIALINPIYYTAENLTKNSWRAIARALTDKGYTVLFNRQGNSGDEGQVASIVPEEYISIYMPAYLCPLAGQNVGLVCGRNGGGFNLLHSFLRPQRSLLILIEHDELSRDRWRDPRKEDALWNMHQFKGHVVDHITVVSLSDEEQSVYDKAIVALNS